MLFRSKLKSARETVLKPRIFKANDDYAAIGVPNDIIVTIGRGQAASLTSTAKLNKEPLIAPLAAGQAVGELTVTDASGQVVAQSPLVPLQAVPEGGFWARTADGVRLWFH